MTSMVGFAVARCTHDVHCDSVFETAVIVDGRRFVGKLPLKCRIALHDLHIFIEEKNWIVMIVKRYVSQRCTCTGLVVGDLLTCPAMRGKWGGVRVQEL